MSDKYLKVSTVAGYIKGCLHSEDMLQNIQVVGEVSGIRTSGRHAYFTIKDDEASIDCSYFNYSGKYLPKNGESIIIVGSVDFYEKSGRLSIIVRKAENAGQGLLALRLEELKKRLESQGYFDIRHKKEIPLYPKNVCVVTSKSGAVIRDIVTTVRKKNNILDIYVYDVKVQGENCASSVIEALSIVDKLGFDVIIIARGGGSMEDLMPFNSEELVYKIFECKTPIISAVGHETDFTLCDFVADRRVPTPTASGELVGYDVSKIIDNIIDRLNMLKRLATFKLDSATSSLNNKMLKLKSECMEILLSSENKIKNNAIKMTNCLNGKYNDSKNKVLNILALLDANNPARILKQGYSKLYDESGHAIDIEGLEIGDRVTILDSHGRANATIESISKN